MCSWLATVTLDALVPLFREEDISGLILRLHRTFSFFSQPNRDLTVEEMKEDLGISFGNRKSLVTARQVLLDLEKELEDTEKVWLCCLLLTHSSNSRERKSWPPGWDYPKAYWAKVLLWPYNNKRLSETRNGARKRTSGLRVTGHWLTRSWSVGITRLVGCDALCRVLGVLCTIWLSLEKGWLDAKAILGVGIYHAPRFLSEAEKQRELQDKLDGESYNVERKKKMKAGEVQLIIIKSLKFTLSRQLIGKTRFWFIQPLSPHPRKIWMIWGQFRMTSVVDIWRY